MCTDLVVIILLVARSEQGGRLPRVVLQVLGGGPQRDLVHNEHDLWPAAAGRVDDAEGCTQLRPALAWLPAWPDPRLHLVLVHRPGNGSVSTPPSVNVNVYVVSRCAVNII